MDMNDRPKQDPSAAFTRIISMMLASIRARGWRGLKEWPKILLATMVVRGYGRAFAALVAHWRAGKFAVPVPVPAPVPAPSTEAPEREAARAQPSTRHRPSGRHYPACFYRQQPDECPALPAAAGVGFASARPRARGRTAVWPRPHRCASDPFAAFRLPAGIFATGRSP